MRAAGDRVESVLNQADNPGMVAQRRPARRVLGASVVAVSALWLAGWGLVAALADTFGTDGSGAWAIIGAALALGVAGVALGTGLARGRAPGRWGWVAWGVAILAPFALAFQDDHGAAGVEAAVEAAYVDRSDARGASADCGYAAENEDGSEFWSCDVEATPYDLDTCNVDVTRPPDDAVKAEITYCLNDDLAQLGGIVEEAGDVLADLYDRAGGEK